MTSNLQKQQVAFYSIVIKIKVRKLTKYCVLSSLCDQSVNSKSQQVLHKLHSYRGPCFVLLNILEIDISGFWPMRGLTASQRCLDLRHSGQRTEPTSTAVHLQSLAVASKKTLQIEGHHLLGHFVYDQWMLVIHLEALESS